jgi:hypothetical protein
VQSRLCLRSQLSQHRFESLRHAGAKKHRRSSAPGGVRRSQVGLLRSVHRTEARPAGTPLRASAGTPPEQPRRSNAANQLRTSGRIRAVALRAGSRGLTDVRQFRGRTRAPTPAPGWTLARSRHWSSRGWLSTAAPRGPRRRQVKFTCHQEVISRPALRCSAEFGDNTAGDRPFPS